MAPAQLVTLVGFEWHVGPEGGRLGSEDFYIRHLSKNYHLSRVNYFVLFALEAKTQLVGSISAPIEIKCVIGKRLSQRVI